MLFPPLVIILFVTYSCCWLAKKCDQENWWTEDPDSWAITIVHAIISSTFILYVIGLDIAALAFRDHTPEYHNESYNEHLYHYPGLLLLWDIIAVIIPGVLIFIRYCYEDQDKCIYLLLKLTGVAPLLSLAAHAHYIIITWITDPLYATGIGINYAIFYVIHLVMLNESYKRAKHCYDSDTCQKNTVVLAVAAVVSLAFQILVTAFFVYIPINNSIEETPSTLLTIIQGVTVVFIIHGISAVFLGLIAWKVIVDPRDNATQPTTAGAATAGATTAGAATAGEATATRAVVS